MTDMFTGMPFYWQGPAPMANVPALPSYNPTPASTASWLNNLNAQNQANTPDYTAWATAINNNAYNAAVEYARLNSSIGGGFRGDYAGAPGGGYQDPFNPYAETLRQQGGGGGSIFDTGAPAFNPYGGGANPGGFSPSPNYPGGGGGGYQIDPFTGAIMGTGGIGSDMLRGGQNGPANPYANIFQFPAANPSYFNPGSYAGDLGNYGIPYNGAKLPGDIGFTPQPSYPNIGYNPGMENWFANPGMGGGAFQGRFGMGFPNAGTPSQVMPQYGETLTNADRYMNGYNAFDNNTWAGFRMDQQ